MGDKFKAEDEKQKERIAAKNNLESYCFNMKSTMDDEKLKDKISEDDKRMIISKWVEAVCNPIITKMYQQGGAPGGGLPDGMPGGMPNGMQGGMPNGMPHGKANHGSGPTIEEVD